MGTVEAVHHLTRMEKRGLVERRICCSDGRGAIIHLTDQGMKALQQAAPGHAALVRRVVFGGLDQGHLNDLETILSRICDGLTEEEKSQLGNAD